MIKLKLASIDDNKPVKLTVALPAALHRNLVAYAEILAKETGKPVEANQLIAPMLERFIASDRGFAALRNCVTLPKSQLRRRFQNLRSAFLRRPSKQERFRGAEITLLLRRLIVSPSDQLSLLAVDRRRQSLRDDDFVDCWLRSCDPECHIRRTVACAGRFPVFEAR